jgi:hypothetical protein
MPVDMTPPAEVRFYRELADKRDGYRLLDCIRQVEGAHGATPGAHGELGPFQFKRETWEHLTHLPFNAECACDPLLSFSIAAIHFHEIRIALLRAALDPTPARVAAAWNAGVGAVINHRVPKSALDYAARVTNLFYAHIR